MSFDNVEEMPFAKGQKLLDNDIEARAADKYGHLLDDKLPQVLITQ